MLVSVTERERGLVHNLQQDLTEKSIIKRYSIMLRTRTDIFSNVMLEGYKWL